MMNEQVQAAIDASAKLAALAPPSADPLVVARNGYLAIVPLAGEPEPVYVIVNHLIETSTNQIPVRIYKPSAGLNLPAVIFFHGGWFFAGDLESHETPLRALANRTECIIIAVDYRLAPEHPFPAAIEDGYAVLQWVISKGADFGIDSNRIIIAGDSAGGNIATVIARKATQNQIPGILLQVLLYPVTDPALENGSWQQFADGPVITREIARQAWGMYVRDEQERQNPDAAPILAENLSGSPAALIIVAECDPLRDEGLAYSERLQQAGVKTKTSLYREMPHGFFQMAGYIDDGKKAIEEVAVAIKKVLRN